MALVKTGSLGLLKSFLCMKHLATLCAMCAYLSLDVRGIGPKGGVGHLCSKVNSYIFFFSHVNLLVQRGLSAVCNVQFIQIEGNPHQSGKSGNVMGE